MRSTVYEPSLDREVRFWVYRYFVDTGRAPTLEELASELGTEIEVVAGCLGRLAAAHELALAPGTENVWMAHPFSAVPTPYPVVTAVRRYWATCAWDALAMPPLLEADGDIATTCADCCEPLTLQVRRGVLEPTDAVVHFALPPRRFWDNIGHT